jgi:hypothetical protein
MWHVDFVCACALFILFFFFPIQEPSVSSVDRPVPKNRWTGIRPMFSPARINKLLAYPWANADNLAVPDRRSYF